MTAIILIIISYLLGCFNTGYYFTKFIYQQDIREVGTNVTGAMNVSRVAGKKGFAVTFLGDALKGAIPVMLCRLLKFSDMITLICILMVIAGHIFPLQLKGKGGKGMSTAFGAFLAYNPLLIIYLLLTCGVILPFARRYTITGLFALILLPVELIITAAPWYRVCFFLLYAMLILYACRDNLREYFHFHQQRRD